MKRVIVISVILAFTLSYANAEEKEAKSEEILADVNGVKITLGDFEKEVATLPENYRRMVDANKRQFLDEFILREILYQEAIKKGLDKDKEIISALEIFKKKLLVQTLLEKEVVERTTVSEDEVKQYYEEHKDDFKIPEQVNAAHILVKVEETADEAENKAALEKAESLLKRIKEGSDFSELAKENSDCPSGSRGGELGYFSRGRMVPEFEEAALKLKAGEVSDIVKTKFGYHIIKILERKEASQKEFSEVREEIEQKLLEEKWKSSLSDYTEALKGKAKITINEELLLKKGGEE